MCDFHSICVRRDGAIAHAPSNSHSGSIVEAGWRENDAGSKFRDSPFFVEAEWDGVGDFPGVNTITRNFDKINAKQSRVIETHYRALAMVLSDPAQHAQSMCVDDGGVFSAPQYADVRWRVLVNPKTPPAVAYALAQTALHASGEPIKSLHPGVTKLGGSLVVDVGCTLTAPALTEVGHVHVSEGATFTAPALTGVGYAFVFKGATFTAPDLTNVSGTVFVCEGATLTAPNLKR